MLAGMASPLLAVGAAFDPDAIAYFDAMTSPPSVTRKNQINTLVKALKNKGAWRSDSQMFLLASHDRQSAGLNLFNPSSAVASIPAVNNGFVVDRGVSGSSQQACQLPRAPFGAGAATIGLFVRNWASGSDYALIPQGGVAAPSATYTNNNDGSYSFSLTANLPAASFYLTDTLNHHYGIAVSGSGTAFSSFLDGASYGSGEVFQQPRSPSASTLAFMYAGAVGQGPRSPVYYAYAAQLPSATMVDLHTALLTYLTSIGAN